MHRIVFPILFLCFFVTEVRAHEVTALIGLHLTQFSSEGTTFVGDDRASVGLGVSFAWQFDEDFAAELGLLYTQRSVGQANSTNPALQDNYTLRSFQLPLIARYRVIDFLSLGAGVYANFSRSRLGYSLNDTPGTDVNSFFDNIDGGVLLLIRSNFDLDVSGEWFGGLDIRYLIPIGNLLNDAQGGVGSIGLGQTQVNIGLGRRF